MLKSIIFTVFFLSYFDLKTIFFSLFTFGTSVCVCVCVSLDDGKIKSTFSMIVLVGDREEGGNWWTKVGGR
jgi:hypothetical protein